MGVVLTSEIASVVVGGDEEFLFLDPALLVIDVAEELMQRVGLVEARATVRRLSAHAIVTLDDRVDLLSEEGK